MFPLNDTYHRNTFPFINYLIIAINIVVFVYQFFVVNAEEIIFAYGFIPQHLSQSPTDIIPLLTSMWVHGGILHIAANLWFLHIFGDNVEDRLGHIKYLIFYIIAGVVATLAQYVIEPGSTVPMVGASGAISGVTGMYMIHFGGSRIRTLVPSFFGFWHVVQLPSWIFLGYWFLVQLLLGFGSLGSSGGDGAEGGVAVFAHIGGFVFGWIAAYFIRRNPQARENNFM